METYGNIQEFVIEKRNELAKELYDFFGSQKGEMFHYIDERTQHLSEELYGFITAQKSEVLDAMYTQTENINLNLTDYIRYEVNKAVEDIQKKQKENQDFLYIKSFFEQNAESDISKIILLGIPEHGNLGDHAITCGERSFFRRYFRKYPLLELSWEMANNNSAYLMDKICKRDLICIQGGGFLGSLWENEQEQVNRMIERFHENAILILPQTYWCADNESARLIVERFGQAMSRCENICVCLREKESYERFKAQFPKIPVLMIPDMALCIQTKLKEEREDYVLLCMRDDKEKIIECGQKIRDLIAESGLKYKETSTVLDMQIPHGMDEKYVWDKLDEFAKAKFVVTDRLHGMVFAALTGTPCVAFDNVSGKVKGVYQWLSDVKEIKIVHSEKMFEEVFGGLIKGSLEDEPYMSEQCFLDLKKHIYSNL